MNNSEHFRTRSLPPLEAAKGSSPLPIYATKNVLCGFHYGSFRKKNFHNGSPISRVAVRAAVFNVPPQAFFYTTSTIVTVV